MDKEFVYTTAAGLLPRDLIPCDGPALEVLGLEREALGVLFVHVADLGRLCFPSAMMLVVLRDANCAETEPAGSNQDGRTSEPAYWQEFIAMQRELTKRMQKAADKAEELAARLRGVRPK